MTTTRLARYAACMHAVPNHALIQGPPPAPPRVPDLADLQQLRARDESNVHELPAPNLHVQQQQQAQQVQHEAELTALPPPPPAQSHAATVRPAGSDDDESTRSDDNGAGDIRDEVSCGADSDEEGGSNSTPLI